MHRVAPCQQDGLEMVPLGQVLPQCRSSNPEVDARDQPEEHKEPPPSQGSCCLIRNSENSPADSTGETLASVYLRRLHIFAGLFFFFV